MTLIQDLHAAISRRDWSAVEVAANRLRDADLEKLLASKSEECANLANSLDGSEHARSELTARVKELDRCHEGTIDLCNQKTAEIKALEAKLAAAERALEPFAEHANDRAVDDTGWRDKETVKIVVSIGDLRKARAALGGKPS